MSNDNPDRLPIAVRVYPQAPTSDKVSPRNRKRWHRPDTILVFDTETRIDATQALTFGSYRFFRKGRCLEEGLFYGDDLQASEKQALREYVASHRPDTTEEGLQELLLLSRGEFVDRLYSAAYKGRCLLVGFNLPFDLARVAFDFTSARGRFAGGFSLGLWAYSEAGGERSNSFRPRIGIKQIDSKRALKGFTGRNSPDREDLIPEGSQDGTPQEGYKFRGHFLDLRTLAFALTDRGYSLESACEAFDVEHGKQRAAVHGVITSSYIDYNRRDVVATAELAEKLVEEYAKHPILLQPTKAYSPASIGKAYLREMGVVPILERQPDFPKAYLGYAQSAFFGGRTSAHIRKTAVPVVYTDFLSMYPTVNSLMGLWRFVIADRIKIVEHCQKDIEALITGITPDQLFKQATWNLLTGFVQIIPDGDILPSRSKYSAESNDWQVAVNYISGDTHNSQHALWFSLPDIVASVILTGHVPKIIDAFRIEPVGTAPSLRPISLRGTIKVNPHNQDFFKIVIEQRKSLASRKDISEGERKRLDKALKVLANSTSYGIYAEMNRQESENESSVICHGIDERPFTCRVAHPEVPGEYCFSPLAALITGAARLMLALLERSVTDLKGTYAMEDTDSMAIVATENGSLVPCPSGSFRTGNRRAAIKALSWEEVDEITRRFEALNPYDRKVVPGSILKIEGDNFDLVSRDQRQLYCFAISAKRYALFVIDARGTPALLRKGANNDSDHLSEHGLGHLLNPTDPTSADRNWIGQVWLRIIRSGLGLPVEKLPFEDVPAVGRVTVSSPAVMRPLCGLNEGKKYAAKIKPFNFLLTCHVKQLGHPIGTDATRFHLITPYESDPRQWLRKPWIDQYAGKSYRIMMAGEHGTRHAARVKTYGDVCREYEFHPEAKSADHNGGACGKQTVGLLRRRHVHIDLIKYIGKESNHLEDVDAGLIHSQQGVYTEYPDPRRDEWQTKILPVLKTMPLSVLIEKSGLSRRAVLDIRAGRSRPHGKNQGILTTIVQEWLPEEHT
jgi:hypothetical protein